MAQRKRLLALLLALCLFASFLGTLPRAYATEESLGIGTVDIGQPGKTTPIYDKPNGTPTHWLKDGTDVSILGMEKGKNGEWWYKVRYTPDVVGYIQATRLSTNVTPNTPSTPSTTSPTGKVGIVNEKVTSSLLVRSKPATKGYKILERLSPGDKVTVIGTEISDGIKYDIVLTEKGNKGWCTSGYISTSAPTSSPSSSDLPGEIIGENGHIICRCSIYKYDPTTESMIPISVIFLGGEEITVEKIFTDKHGDQFYLVKFGTRINYVRKNNAIRDSEEEFHGRPLSVDTSKKGIVNTKVKSCLLQRSHPSETEFTVLGKLHCGDEVTIIQTTTIDDVKWHRLPTEDGQDSWVKAMYIDITSSPQDQSDATSPKIKHEPVDGIGQVRGRTTAYKYCGQKSKEDKTFLGGEIVELFDLATIGNRQQYGCKLGSKEYYVDKSFISTSVQPSSSAQDTSKPQNVNLQGMVRVQTRLSGRSEPSTSADVVESLFNGASVEVLETKTVSKTKWYLVRTQKGNKVWCLAAYIEIGTWKLISTGTTTSTTSSTNSRYNASLACSELDGIVILSQHKFSWVKIMGACSKDDGYKESTVFKNGKRVKGYGGGVCQVSTTINIAIKNAGLKTQAHKHSLPVSYATRDQEATVAYPSVDFSFVNTKNSELMLRLTANNGSCTCNVYMWIKK